MNVAVTVITVILALPLLVLVGIAMGPAALVIIFITGLALLTLLLERLGLRHRRGRRL